MHMSKRRRKARTTLPLPKSWVINPNWKLEKRSFRDAALDATAPNPGTKKFFKMMLQTAGWGGDSLDEKSGETLRSKISELSTEIKSGEKRNLDTLCTNFREEGLLATPVKYDQHYTKTLWESLAQRPWWLSTDHGAKSLVVAGNSTERLETASALFMRDLWTPLKEGPLDRFPKFRRINLLTLMDPSGLATVLDDSKVDLLILYGGLLDADSLYDNFSYLSAISSSFSGFILYELLLSDDASRRSAVAISNRTGFPNVVGV